MVRSIKHVDMDNVEKMMYELWPDYDGDVDFTKNTFFVWDDNGTIGGFIMIGIRPYVDGADSSPCPHIAPASPSASAP